MKLAERIFGGLRALAPADWTEACPAGPPLPESERCLAIDCESVRLAELAVGDRGTVSCLEAPGSAAACKLAGLGVLPGVRLTVVQRYPAFVFRIGYSEFAVDAALADHIRVRRGDGLR